MKIGALIPDSKSLPDRYRSLRVLIVGLGSIGVRHLENLRGLGVETIGVFRSLNRPPHRAVDMRGVREHVGGFADALRHGYEVVMVCNPTSLHIPVSTAAAARGCHLYIEKPVSHNIRGLRKLQGVIEEKKLKAAVGCQIRFHKNLLDIKGWLDSGKIGRTLSVNVDTGEYLPGWHPWESYKEGYAARRELGGGAVLTTIHDIDYLLWLFGPMTILSAAGGSSGTLQVDVEDYASSMLLSHDNVPIFLHLDFLQHPPCRRMKIIGSRGSIDWDYYRGIARLTGGVNGDEVSEVPPGWQRNDMFVAILSDFLEAIAEDRPPQVGLEQGFAALRIALEIKKRIAERPAK
jgi:predicted dehydrogenase